MIYYLFAEYVGYRIGFTPSPWHLYSLVTYMKMFASSRMHGYRAITIFYPTLSGVDTNFKASTTLMLRVEFVLPGTELTSVGHVSSVMRLETVNIQ